MQETGSNPIRSIEQKLHLMTPRFYGMDSNPATSIFVILLGHYLIKSATEIHIQDSVFIRIIHMCKSSTQ